MGRRTILLWVIGSVLLGVGLLAVLVVPAIERSRRVYADPVIPEYADWVEDSGLPSSMGGEFWLEDGRLLFPMLRIRESPDPQGYSVWQRFLAIWRPGTPAEAVEIHTEDYGGGLCYAEGNIRYFLEEREDGRHVRMIGPMGRERRVTRADRFPGLGYNRLACRLEPWPERWAGQRGFWPLRPGHGWIGQHYAGGRNPDETTFYPTEDHSGIDIDVRVIDLSSTCVRWIGWRQAYFTDYCGSRQETDYYRLRGVWLWPDGRVEVPDLPHPRSVGRVWPVPAGWLVSSYDVNRNGELRASGLYLWREGEYRLLIPGIVREMAVSDDGCRVAFGHAPSRDVYRLDRDWHLRTLKIVDLCGYLDRILAEVPVIDPFAGRN